MDSLDAVAGGAAVVDGQGAGDDMFPLQVIGGAAVGAGFGGLGELSVFAQDVGPFFFVVLEIAEGFFYKTVSGLFRIGSERCFADYFGVLEVDQVAYGFYVTVGHGLALFFPPLLLVGEGDRGDEVKQSRRNTRNNPLLFHPFPHPSPASTLASLIWSITSISRPFMLACSLHRGMM